IQELRRQRDIEFVAILIGTGDEPQDTESQSEKLKESGVTVFRTATGAVEYASLRLGSIQSEEFPAVNLEPFNLPLAAINVGLESFYHSLKSQEAQAVQVDWRPPAGGNEKLASLLSRMKK
ncbi:MAG: hypothetical protein M3Y68_05235, partial [Chloroflexota bacterium]|nr:hypothetical protein [Chloroflexota bacterium]